MCVCLSVYLCTTWGQEPTQVRRGIMSLGLELQVVMNHHADARNWTQILCENNEYEYIYEFERNFMSLAKGSFCKSKNQGIGISWMVFKYYHMCECMCMYVCSESALLLQRQDTSFMGEQVTKLYNSHFSWASRELALTAFCFPVVLGFCVGSAVFFLRHEDSL